MSVFCSVFFSLNLAVQSTENFFVRFRRLFKYLNFQIGIKNFPTREKSEKFFRLFENSIVNKFIMREKETK